MNPGSVLLGCKVESTGVPTTGKVRKPFKLQRWTQITIQTILESSALQHFPRPRQVTMAYPERYGVDGVDVVKKERGCYFSTVPTVVFLHPRLSNPHQAGAIPGDTGNGGAMALQILGPLRCGRHFTTDGHHHEGLGLGQGTGAASPAPRLVEEDNPQSLLPNHQRPGTTTVYEDKNRHTGILYQAAH